MRTKIVADTNLKTMEDVEKYIHQINGNYIVKDGTRTLMGEGDTFREATSDEVQEFDRYIEEHERKKEKLMTMNMRVRVHDVREIKPYVRYFEKQIDIYAWILTHFEGFETEFPYINFGKRDLEEAIGYLERVVYDLKNIIKE